jgi:hypothetical protein
MLHIGTLPTNFSRSTLQSGWRREFDKLHGISQEASPKFSGLAFFDALGLDAVLRAAIL